MNVLSPVGFHKVDNPGGEVKSFDPYHCSYSPYGVIFFILLTEMVNVSVVLGMVKSKDQTFCPY